jgi:hypothetical protein
LRHKDHVWSDVFGFWYEVRKRSFRATLGEGTRLDSRLIEQRMNELIVAAENGEPTGVRPEAGQMEVEDVPVPEALPASLWDGWMTGFKPGQLARR